MKKLMSLLLAAALILTTVGGLCISVSADETDITIADFSVAGGAAGFGAVNGYKHADNMTSEVTRTGKDYSLKWTDFHEKVNADDNTGNSRIQTPVITTVGEVLNHKYFNAWIYSAVANDQLINLYMYDQTTKTNAFLKSGSLKHKIKVDWTGWKLVSIPFDDTVLADFNNSTTEAQETDNVYMWLQTTGYGTKALDTSVLYIDSIWLSSSDPTTISQTDEVTFSVANNATDISKSQKQYAFTANKAFAYGIGNLNDYTEVKINGTALTAGTDYTVQQEHNVLYITLNSNLPDGASCSFGLKAETPFANGSSLAAAFTSSFTAKSDFFMIGDFSKPGIKFVKGDSSTAANWKTLNAPELMVQKDEVTMSGKEASLKWGNHTDGSADASKPEKYAAINTRLCSPQMDNIVNALKYDKIGIWMYSAKANDQVITVLLHNTVKSDYISHEVTVDWTGWKLVSIDVAGNFNKATTPEDTDKWALNLQTSGWNSNPFPDTLLYVDSIFLYNDGYFDTYDGGAEKIFDLSNLLSKDYVNGVISGETAVKRTPAKNDVTYSGNEASVKIDPYTTNVMRGSGLAPNLSRNINLEEYNKKYLNFVMYSSAANDQTVRISLEGALSSTDTRTLRYYKDGYTINWTGWKMVSIKLTDLAAQDGRIWKDETIINTLKFYIPNWQCNVDGIKSDTLLYLDSVWLSDYDMSATSDIESTIAEGASVSSATKSIGFTFPTYLQVGKDYSDKISVKCNGADVAKSEYKVQQEGNKLYAVFANGLNPKSSYSITMSSMNNEDYITSAAKTVNFTTQAAHYDLTYSFGADGSMTVLPEDGSVMANAKLTNATAADTTARIITAVYDKDGNLVTAGISESVTVKKGKSAMLSKSVTAESYAGCTVKCYVWQWDSLVPYSGEIGQLK